MRLILASASPRRAALLSAAGLTFVVRPVEVDESAVQDEAPADYVLRVAALKCRALDQRSPGDVVLAADTIVVIGGRMLGKPADEAEARVMLRALSGRDHEVLTGVVLTRAGRQLTSVETSRVRFTPMEPSEIAWYAATGEPFDKAGGYAVQGLASRFVDRIDGSYSNVVGLPVARVYRMLRELLGPEWPRFEATELTGPGFGDILDGSAHKTL